MSRQLFRRQWTKAGPLLGPLPGGWLPCLVLLVALLSSCRYPAPSLDAEGLTAEARDSLRYLHERHYTWDTNLEVAADSVTLACLPVKDSYYRLRRGDRLVVAEFAVHPADSVDSVWVKLAHSQEVQGWMRECDLKRDLVPSDSISQAIHLFSNVHVGCSLAVFALCVLLWLVRAAFRKQFRLVYFRDIDSAYPLLLCLLMASSATLYETMQLFHPDMWEHFYYNPTLSPFEAPCLLSLFLLSLWAFVIVLLAAVDDCFHQLSPVAAVSYLLGLASACIFCYFFFVMTTALYVGYLFLLLLTWLFLRRAVRSFAKPLYRCGRCGHRLREKGTCPRCGAVNETY